MKIEMEVNSISIFDYDKIIPLELFWRFVMVDSNYRKALSAARKPKNNVNAFLEFLDKFLVGR